MSILCIFSIVFTALFSANIAVVGSQQGDPHIADYLKKHLLQDGHAIDVLWENDDFRNYDIILSSNYKRFLDKYKSKVIISCYEPEVIISRHADYNHLRKYLGVFSWNHHLAGKYGFQKFFYPCDLQLDQDPLKLRSFDRRKLACIVNSFIFRRHPNELYSKRKEVAEFYKQNYPNELSLYGSRGWDDSLRPVYKGFCEDKGVVLKNHKFTYCYENWDNNVHYISEKIFDAINHLCVPIYLGSTNITDFVPKETFIDARNFSSIQEIHEFISNMSEETYMTYIHAMIKYNKTPGRKRFTQDHYKKSVLEYIKSKLI
ncbi:MAG: hypothetical protein S4CHLAM20_13130 [Chlamydiia bacterium]|nr:hypothetical protein [Chlamydiia bacterium]